MQHTGMGALASPCEYQSYCELIEPDRSDSHSVWFRLAFATQSVHENFTVTCNVMRPWRDYLPSHDEYEEWAHACGSIGYKRKADSAEYLSMSPLQYLKGEAEGWDEYRQRLRNVPGLGLAKSSFAVALLYPTVSPIVCIDTHMQRWYGKGRGGTLKYDDYILAEGEVRWLAEEAGVCAFAMQWYIWDSMRGRVEQHEVLRGV